MISPSVSQRQLSVTYLVVTILMVTLLTTCAPSAVAVTQISQVYSDQGRYASFINVVTTLLCIITMPLIIALYQIL